MAENGITRLLSLTRLRSAHDRMKARTLAIARGEHKPAGGEPTVWFTSTDSLAKVLSGRNRELLATIAREKPDSITELAELAGRSKSSLSPVRVSVNTAALPSVTSPSETTVTEGRGSAAAAEVVADGSPST